MIRYFFFFSRSESSCWVTASRCGICPCPPSPSKSTVRERASSSGGGQQRPRILAKSLSDNSQNKRWAFIHSKPLFLLFCAYNKPRLVEGFLSLTELRTPHGALNIVASPLAANEFKEVGREGGIQKPRWVQTTNDWWFVVVPVAHLFFSNITLHCCLQ